jgi:ABC-2 type transport system permease protein
MAEVIALVRASWLVATSYRLSFLISLGGLVVGVVPMYFIAGAIQPVVAESIRTEGGQYFGFLLVGIITYSFMATAVGTLPSSLSGMIGSGTLEALLNTPARLPRLLLGFCAYPLLWTTVQASLMVTVGALFGAAFAGSSLFVGLPLVLLIVLTYVPFGLISASFVLMFRTATPLNQVVLAVSMLLGGVYYSTTVIPSWMGAVSHVVPLTYGLRALRRVVLEGMPVGAVRADLAILLLFAAVLWAVGVAAFAYALRYSRHAGTLSHY